MTCHCCGIRKAAERRTLCLTCLDAGCHPKGYCKLVLEDDEEGDNR